MKKMRVGILCGGKSAEHEISLLSAQNVVQAINKEKYDVVVIEIDRCGKWSLQEASYLSQYNKNLHKFTNSDKEMKSVRTNKKEILIADLTTLDVIFPVLHGPFGEDGTVQGFLKLAEIPFVGAGVLGSALGMDKDVTKRLLREARIPVAEFLVFRDNEINAITFDKIKKKLGLPFFVKPANLGSSVGVSKVDNKKEFKQALAAAFSYDTKILIEQEIVGREIECAVLGNETIQASIPGEVILHDKFYSYNAKYVNPNGAELHIPANLSSAIRKKIQKFAIQTAQTLCVEGMARVDFFLTFSGEIIVNEINTIPGFTNISMYPKLWEKSGITYTQLLDMLIKLALERHKKEQKFKTSVIV